MSEYHKGFADGLDLAIIILSKIQAHSWGSTVFTLEEIRNREIKLSNIDEPQKDDSAMHYLKKAYLIGYRRGIYKLKRHSDGFKGRKVVEDNPGSYLSVLIGDISNSYNEACQNDSSMKVRMTEEFYEWINNKDD